MTSYSLQNIRGGLARIKAWMSVQGRGMAISPDDLKLYKMIEDAKMEYDGMTE